MAPLPFLRPPAPSLAGSGLRIVDFVGADLEAKAQAAINKANELYLSDDAGRRVIFPAGTTDANLTWKSGAHLDGEGPGASFIKSKANARKHVLAGGTTSTPLRHIGLHGITIDGNKSTQSGGDPALINGVDFAAIDFEISNARILSCLGRGWSSALVPDGATGFGAKEYPGFVSHLLVEGTGREGVRMEGPHDCHMEWVYTIDASQEANAGYNGFHAGDGFNGRILGLHSWCGGSGNNFPKFAASIGSNIQTFGCHFEGARRQLEVRGNQNTLMGSQVYAPRSALTGQAGDALVVIWGDLNQMIGGVVAVPETSDTFYSGDLFGVQFGTDAHAATSNALINVHVDGAKMRGPFNFYRDNGSRIIKCTGYVGATDGAKPVAGVFPSFTPPGQTFGSLGPAISPATEWDYHQRGGTEYRAKRLPFAYEDNIVATGGGGSTSRQLTCAANRVTTRTSTDFGVKLRSMSLFGHEPVFIRNVSAGNITVYPAAGDTIEETANGNAYVVIAPDRGIWFVAMSPTKWAPSYMTPPTLY